MICCEGFKREICDIKARCMCITCVYRQGSERDSDKESMETEASCSVGNVIEGSASRPPRWMGEARRLLWAGFAKIRRKKGREEELGRKRG